MMRPDVQGAKPMLEARGLSFSYGNKAVFSGVDLEVAPGERVALSAPSGRGKTTLCRVLAGYLLPTAGDVLVDGKPLPRHGMCPVQLIGQHPEQMLDPRMTMAKSLREASTDGAETERISGLLGIRPVWLTRRPHELSGGEMQRFCIARALLANPRYLIADEISTMLDAVTQARIWNVLLNEADARGFGLLFVSHSPALSARIATRTLEL